MDSRELVQLAKALTSYDNVRVLSVTIAVGEGEEIDYHVLHSNDDLFRPFHIGDLGFDDAEAVLEYLTQ